jgi:acetyl esterase/lipase
MRSNIRRSATLAVVFVVWLALLGGTAQAAHRGRYLDPVFSSFATTNITYGHAPLSDGTFATLKLDLYRPYGDTAANRPVVIFVHGGGSASDKALKRNRSVAAGFAQRGFVAASVNYRPGQAFGNTPEAQYDVRAAVRWFKANAAKYRINPNWITVMGSSAGAVNALNVAFHPEDPGASGHPDYPSTVAAAISVSGYASEAWNIGPGEVPIAMFHATDDTTVPIANALLTCAQTQALGNVCDFYRYDSGGHPPPFLIQYREQITEQSSQFLCKRVLGPVVCHDANGDGQVD